jgi:hypothetical protein
MKRSSIITAAALFAAVMSASPLTAIPAAQTARSMSSLSAQERVQLPAATKVVFQGHTVTLGVLRAQHAALVKRFANASALGRRAGASANRALGGARKAALTGYTIVVESASQYATAPQDMKAFCGAAKATVCLYYPAWSTLYHSGTSASELDPFITDPSLCSADGGTSNPTGCQFLYPLEYTAQFNPGTAGPFRHRANCAPNWLSPVYDPHGAAVVKATPWMTETIGPAPAVCVVRVWTKN